MNLGNDGQSVAGYATGGFVRKTGLALEEGGESIVPATSGTVNYYFPVEIEVVGAIPEHERAALEARIWSQLTEALNRGA
jgi:hypothetical protein